jgi:tetratricopeptide (TPR) repeat protein
MKTTFFILFYLLSFSCLSQQDAYLKKIGVYDKGKSANATIITIDALNTTINDSAFTNTSKAERYSRISIQLAKKIEYPKGYVKALLNMCVAKIYTNQMDSAMIYANIALDYSKKVNIAHLSVLSYAMKANVFHYDGKYDKAIENHFSAIRIAEKTNPKDAIRSYTNIGLLFKDLGNIEKARKYTTKSYRLGKKYNDTPVVVSALNVLGLIEKDEGNLDVALVHFNEGLELSRIVNMQKKEGEILHNISNIYFRMEQYEKSFRIFEKSLAISKENQHYKSVATDYYSLARNFQKVGRRSDAKKAANNSLKYSKLTKQFGVIMEAYDLLSDLAAENGNTLEAFTYKRYAYAYKDSAQFAAINNAVLDAEEKYEDEKKALADSLDQIQVAKDKEIMDEKVKSRDKLLWISVTVLLIVTIGIYLLYKKNKFIKVQNAVLNNQKKEIETQHQEITDSINYAKRIQEAIISNKNEWEQISSERFIFFKPKDVVSGDFYWAHNNQQERLSIWAVADCTGHGVPGAFMSMLGIGFLNEIIIENGISDPGEILNQLRIKIVKALTRDVDNTTKDGMDISLCVWDKNANSVSYAGANNPLWIIRNRTIEEPERVKRKTDDTNSSLTLYEIAPDKMPIGFQLAHPPDFTTQKTTLHPNDLIILFTDGFADQFGGEKGKNSSI